MLWPLPAAGRPVCNFHDTVIERLKEKFSETVAWWGVSSTGALIELTTAENGSWSIIETRPDGWACLVSMGEGSRTVDPQSQLKGTVL